MDQASADILLEMRNNAAAHEMTLEEATVETPAAIRIVKCGHASPKLLH